MARRSFSGFDRIADDIRARAAMALRGAAEEVLGDFTEIGPEWSGDFRQAWNAKANGRIGRVDNVPMVSVAEVRQNRAETTINNPLQYATQAMDLEPGDFAPRGRRKGKIVAQGERQNNIRGDIKEGAGNNVSTAPLHWYTDYMDGGQFRAAFIRGAKRGFGGSSRRPAR